MRNESGRRERWARVRRSLWQPPRPHGEAPRERTVGPLELFYDLAVVVLVAQAAHRLAGQLTQAGGARGAAFAIAAAVAAICLAVGAARPAPLVLGLALVLLLSVPWALAVARRLANEDAPPTQSSRLSADNHERGSHTGDVQQDQR